MATSERAQPPAREEADKPEKAAVARFSQWGDVKTALTIPQGRQSLKAEETISFGRPPDRIFSRGKEELP